MSDDTNIARVFADRLNVDGQHKGARVTLSGEFERIEMPGPARLAASGFRFVVADVVGLVAMLPDGVRPEIGVAYSISGALEGVGEFGLFPGIVIDECRRA